MNRKKIVCWLIGHDDSGTLVDPYDTCCFRCGLEWKYGDYVKSDLWLWLGLCDVRRLFCPWFYQHWFKCPDCGKRFGRHKKNCTPF